MHNKALISRGNQDIPLNPKEITNALEKQMLF